MLEPATMTAVKYRCRTNKKRRIEENRLAALLNKSRKEELQQPRSDKQVHFDPFAEFVETTGDQEEQPVEPDHFDDFADDDTELDDQHNGSESGNTQGQIISTSAKHAISSAKLAKVKEQADQTWQSHIATSVRVSQMAGTVPTIIEDTAEVQPQRFPIHNTHSPIAIRSIVACKQCGYWASKKSQRLQEICLGRPKHSDGAQKLRRMMKGLHPDAKVTSWPDGHDARIPTPPIAVAWG